MTWGPVRSISIGGLALGVVVLIVGILVLLDNQNVIDIVFDLWTICALGLIVLGVVIIGGTVYMRMMARGRWRKWMEWDEPPREQ